MIAKLFVSKKPDPVKRRCYDCFWSRSTSYRWRCINLSKIAEYGTDAALEHAGVCNCPFWSPALTNDSPKHKWRGINETVTM